MIVSTVAMAQDGGAFACFAGAGSAGAGFGSWARRGVIAKPRNRARVMKKLTKALVQQWNLDMENLPGYAGIQSAPPLAINSPAPGAPGDAEFVRASAAPCATPVQAGG